MTSTTNNVFTYINTSGYSLNEYHHIKTALERNLHKAPQANACRQALRQQRLRQINRKGRFQRLVRRVVGGLPVKAYALTLKISYVFEYDPLGTHIQHCTHQYQSKTSELKQDAIDDAIQLFLKETNKSTSWSNSFEGGQAMYVDHELMSIKLLPDAKLAGLPLYRFHKTLADKCCPDDAKIQVTPGQCVINGLFCMMKATKHYAGITEQKLIREIGTNTPSVDQLERWLSSDKYKYRDYVSMNIIDPLNRKLFRHVARKNTVVTITAKVNNQHFYLITQTALREQMKNKEYLDLTLLRIRAELTEHNFEYCDDVSRLVTSDMPYILCETTDLSDQLKKIQSATKTLVNEVSFHHTRVMAFEHPVTNQMYIAAPKFEQRKDAAEVLFKDTSFAFINQTYCQLGKAFITHNVGDIPEETYNQHHLEILDNFPINPYVGRLEEEAPDKTISVDMKNAYPSVLLDMTHDWMVMSFRDKIEPYVQQEVLNPGVYFVTKRMQFANGNMPLRKGWYPHNVIAYCFQHGYISHEDIQYMMKSTFCLPADTFRYCVMSVLKKLPKAGKHVLNHFIGHLGQKH
jgi:hypothetical protein